MNIRNWYKGYKPLIFSEIFLLGFFILGYWVGASRFPTKSDPTVLVTESPTIKVDGWECKDYLAFTSETNSLFVFGSSQAETSQAIGSLPIDNEQRNLAVQMESAIYRQKIDGIKPILNLLTKVCK